MKPKTLFFDVNETLLDLNPLKVSVKNYFNNEPHLAELWFSKMSNKHGRLITLRVEIDNG